MWFGNASDVTGIHAEHASFLFAFVIYFILFASVDWLSSYVNLPFVGTFVRKALAASKILTNLYEEVEFSLANATKTFRYSRGQCNRGRGGGAREAD